MTVVLDRWIKAQRVGLAAYRLSLSTEMLPSSETSKKFADPLDVWNFLAMELDEASSIYPHFHAYLPPVVLQLLLSLTDEWLDSLKKLRPSWEIALTEQLGRVESWGVKQADENKGPDKMPAALGARVLAHHILHGTGKPISVFRLARSIFKQASRIYERNPQALKSLELALKVLRTPWTDTQARLDAVETLSTELRRSPLWPHVENALYHQFFSWPLLVFGGDIGISLPVSVDVYFDGKAGVEVRGDTSINASKWEPSLWSAADAARIMWLGKHRNRGDLRQEVEGASVIYDFSVADKIVTGFPDRVGVTDPSMEAYFSQVILSRLLGNSVSSSSVITGMIGHQREYKSQKLADYEFEWPENVPEKMKYVFRTHFFERIILPDLRDLAPNDRRKGQLKSFLHTYRKEQSTEINFVKHLQHAADSFQVGGWRQFRYIRCPDVAWRIHPNGSRLPAPQTEQVERCLAILQSNKDAVLNLSDVADPVNLAGALWYINTVLREQIPLRQRPPMLSWAFVRATPDEQDARFWHVVWRTTGASRKDFDAFHRTATSETAARHLMDALNCFSPRYSCPSHRAPDLLVILGTKHLSASLSKAKNPLLRGQAFEPVLEQFRTSGMLHPTPYSLMREYVGNTRLVTFHADTISESSDTTDVERPSEGIEQELSKSLSILKLGESEHSNSHFGN